MATKGWQGRQAILTIPNGGTDSDILDLGAMESIEQNGVAAAGGSTTSIITSAILVPTSGQPFPVTTDCFKGKFVLFREGTTTANLRNQKRLITANTSGGVLTVSALSDAPVLGDTFDITDVKPSKSYLRWDIQIFSPATVTASVNPRVSNLEAGTYYTQQSGAADIVIPTGTKATPIIPIVARFLKIAGTAQGQYTHFLVLGSTIQSR